MKPVKAPCWGNLERRIVSIKYDGFYFDLSVIKIEDNKVRYNELSLITVGFTTL